MLFLSHWIHLVLSAYHGCKIIYGTWVASQRTYSWLKLNLPLPLARNCNSSSGRLRTSWTPPPSTMRFQLVWCCTGRLSWLLGVYVCTIPVISSKHCFTTEAVTGSYNHSPPPPNDTLWLYSYEPCLSVYLFIYFCFGGKVGHVHMNVSCL